MTMSLEKFQSPRKSKILWDFSIQTDLQLEHNRPDLVVLDKQQAVCQIIAVAVPGDGRVELKEKEKIDKYQDLVRENKSCAYCYWGTWDNPKRMS